MERKDAMSLAYDEVRIFDMAAFCRRHEPYSKMTKAIVPSHGFRIDTKRFQYMLRCFPEKGDYNFYIYCYDKQAREQERTEPTKKATLCPI